MRRRRLFVALAMLASALGVVTIGVFGHVIPVFASGAQDTIPWGSTCALAPNTTDGVSMSSCNAGGLGGANEGECSQEYEYYDVSEAGTGYASDLGYGIDIACQLQIIDGYTLLGVEPSVPVYGGEVPSSGNCHAPYGFSSTHYFNEVWLGNDSTDGCPHYTPGGGYSADDPYFNSACRMPVANMPAGYGLDVAVEDESQTPGGYYPAYECDYGAGLGWSGTPTYGGTNASSIHGMAATSYAQIYQYNSGPTGETVTTSGYGAYTFHAVQIREFVNLGTLSDAGPFSGHYMPAEWPCDPFGSGSTTCLTNASNNNFGTGHVGYQPVLQLDMWHAGGDYPSNSGYSTSYTFDPALLSGPDEGVAPMPPDYFKGGSADLTPCVMSGYSGPRQSATGPFTTFFSGAAQTFTFSGTNNVDKVYVDWWTGPLWSGVGAYPSPAGGDTIGTASGQFLGSTGSVVLDGTNMSRTPIGAGPSSGWPTPVTSTASSVVLDSDTSSSASVTTGSGSVVSVTGSPTTGVWDPQFFCVSGGQVYYWGDALQPATTAPPPSGLVDATENCLDGIVCLSDLNGCLKTAGFDLYSPSTWIGGLLSDGACVLQWLFIPKTVDGSGFAAPITEHVPGMWVTDAVDAIGTINGQVSAAISGDSACDAPGYNSGSLHSLFPGHFGSGVSQSFGFTLPAPSSLGCTPITNAPTGLGDLWGYRVPLRDVEDFLVWLGLFWFVWRISPWGKRGDELMTSEDPGVIGVTKGGTEVRGDW